MFAVTQATDKHLESVIQLDLEVLGSSIRREFLVASVNKGNVWVALNDYDVVGFVVVDNVFFGHPFIELLIVHPGFRRSGYIENLDEGDPEIVYFKRIDVSDGV